MAVSNNSRIAKNSLYMYIRTILVLLVSLYTSRIILEVLGVEDFGVYNVVAGVVILVSFLNNAMASATQRFLSFEIGTGDHRRLNETFNTILVIHVLIALLVLVLAETLGLWFVNHKLNFPIDKTLVVNELYQLTILAFLLSILQVPFRAAIISNENFKFYSFGNIIEVILKLLIVFILSTFLDNRLVIYGVLVLCVSFVVFLVYFIHCRISYKETQITFTYNSKIFKKLTSYTSWNLFGSLAYVGSTQGINILLNLFFGPVLNAAMAIAIQVQTAVNSFVANVQMTINPQIVKAYASDNLPYMYRLIYVSSKASFFLLILICFPVIIETKFVLSIWLKEVPAYTVVFTKLILINLLIEVISGSLMAAFQATGRIKLYQLVVGTVLILNVPISYVFLKNGALPQTVQFVAITLSIIALILRLLLIQRVLTFSINSFLKEVLLRIFIVCIFACIPVYFLRTMDYGTYRFVVTIILEFITILSSILLFGLSKTEKDILYKKIRSFI